MKGLSAVRLGAAVAIAEWPADVRGFGPVKQRAANAAQARRAQLLAAWDGARKLPELAPHAA